MNPLDHQEPSDPVSETGSQFDSGEHDSPLDHFIRRKVVLLRTATRALRQLKIDEADLDAEGAVDLAFFQLSRSIARREESSIAADEFLKLMTVIIRRVVRDRMRRSTAFKRIKSIANLAARTGAAAEGDLQAVSDSTFTPGRKEIDLDALASSATPIDVVVAVKLEVDAFLERLPDEFHRAVFLLRHEGHSIAEMALRLKVTRKTIERKLRDNQQL